MTPSPTEIDAVIERLVANDIKNEEQALNAVKALIPDPVLAERLYRTLPLVFGRAFLDTYFEENKIEAAFGEELELHDEEGDIIAKRPLEDDPLWQLADDALSRKIDEGWGWSEIKWVGIHGGEMQAFLNILPKLKESTGRIGFSGPKVPYIEGYDKDLPRLSAN